MSTLFVDFAMVLFEYSGTCYPVTTEGEDRTLVQQVASLVYAQNKHSAYGVGSSVFCIFVKQKRKKNKMPIFYKY